MSGFLVSALALAAAGSAAAQCQSVVQAVGANGLSRLGDAVFSVQGVEGSEGLIAAVTATEELAPEAKVTIFAPKNAAWPAPEDLPTGGTLLNILGGHVVPIYLNSGAVLGAISIDGIEVLPTLGATDVTVSKEGERVFVAAAGQPLPGANIIAFDIETCAGVIHVLDQVLIPTHDGMGTDGAPANGMDGTGTDGMGMEMAEDTPPMPCISLADAITDNMLNRLGDAVMSVLELPSAEGLKTLATATMELPEDQKITIFAPQDGAWPEASALPTGETLLGVLTGHVVPQFLTSTTVLDALSGGSPVPLPTLLGSNITASKVGDDVFVAAKGQEMPGAKAVAFDVQTCVGVVHVIDKVLLVSEDAMEDSMAPMATTGGAMGPESATCTSLVMAITENGLDRLGQAVLSIVEDPAAAALKTLATTTMELPEDQKITLFAPNDTAWPAPASLPTGEALLDVLLGHVVPDYLPSSDVIAAVTDMEVVSLDTLAMTELNVTMEDGSVFVAAEGMEEPGAQVIALDIETCVGVVHVVDKVLLAGVVPQTGSEMPGMTEETDPVDLTDRVGGGAVEGPSTPSSAPSTMVFSAASFMAAAAALFF